MRVLLMTVAALLLFGITSLEARQQGCDDEAFYAVMLSTRIHQLAGVNPVVGLFVSIDGGETWEHTGWTAGRMFGAMGMPGGCGDTLFTASGNGVFRTFDGGNFWRITTDWRVTEVQDVTINPGRFGEVFASTPYGIFRTRNFGESWQETSSGLHSRFTLSVRVDRTNPDRMLAATESGLYESTDSGDSWRPTALNVPVRSVRQSQADHDRWVAGLQDVGVALSADGGETWMMAEGPIGGHTIYTAEFHPEDADIVYAGGWETGVFRTEDFGETWERFDAGLDHTSIHGLAISRRDPNVILAGTMGGGLFRSTDGGGSWRAVAEGIFAHGQIWDIHIEGEQ